MNYFLDTDTCIFALKGQHPSIKIQLQSLSPQHIKISAVVKAELLLGARKSLRGQQVLQIVESFLAPFEVVAFDDQATVVYAQLRYELEKKGQGIGPNDLLIAATVIAHQGTLVTHNIREYRRMINLKTEDWTKGK